MPSVAELLAWVRPPLQELATERAANRDKPWSELRASFLTRAGLQDSTDHPLVDGLLGRLDQMSADERGALLDDSAQLEADAYALAAQHADHQDGDAQPAGESYDEAAWQQFLAENGPRWTGDDASWDQFSEWFLYYANDSGVGTPAAALIGHLAAQTAQDRIATFAQYGVHIAAEAAEAPAEASPAGETAPAGESNDEAAWQHFLVENGPRWTGEEESWSQFRTWFEYQANEAGFGEPASALLDLLDSQPAQDRIATFAQYGVTIAGTAAPTGEAQPAQLTEENIQSLLDQTAEFDDIPEERRRELIQQAAASL